MGWFVKWYTGDTRAGTGVNYLMAGRTRLGEELPLQYIPEGSTLTLAVEGYAPIVFEDFQHPGAEQDGIMAVSRIPISEVGKEGVVPYLAYYRYKRGSLGTGGGAGDGTVVINGKSSTIPADFISTYEEKTNGNYFYVGMNWNTPATKLFYDLQIYMHTKNLGVTVPIVKSISNPTWVEGAENTLDFSMEQTSLGANYTPTYHLDLEAKRSGTNADGNMVTTGNVSSGEITVTSLGGSRFSIKINATGKDGSTFAMNWTGTLEVR